MTANSILASRPGVEVSGRLALRATRLRFDLATPQDNPELQRFSRDADMPGAIRFGFDRTPDYLAALCVEGRYSEVLVCREGQTQRLVATGHRSVKPAFVSGEAVPVGYSRIVVREVSTRSLIDLATTALAVEGFRHQSGQLPTTLADLTPEFLE